MPAVLGTSAAMMDDTTLIVFRGNRKPVPPDRKRDLARRCGVQCIKLSWKGTLNSTIAVAGFQHVKLRVMEQPGGGKLPAAQWDKNEYTLEPKAEGGMDFVPDEMGTGWAYLPDSPFNRVMLAKAEIGKNALWEIEDPDIKSEIEALAVEIKQSIEHKEEEADLERRRAAVAVDVQQKNVKTGSEQLTKIEIENIVLENTIKKMEAEEKRRELQAKITALKAKRPDLIQEIPAVEVGAEKEAPVSKPLSATERSQIRAEAKEQIYAENTELIDNIKQIRIMSKGNEAGWAMTKEYREQVAPLVEERLKKLLNEHSTTGVAA